MDVGRAMAEQQARALQAVRDAERERVVASANHALNSKDGRGGGSPAPPPGLASAASAVSAAVNELSRQQKEKEQQQQQQQQQERNERMVRLRGEEDEDEDIVEEVGGCSPPPMKRERHDSAGEGRTSNGRRSPQGALGGANIRISSRGKSRLYLHFFNLFLAADCSKLTPFLFFCFHR